MSERYNRLYCDEKLIYYQDSPIILEARALLKDNDDGTVVGQAKFKNVSCHIISAVFISVALYNAASKPIGNIKHEYLDLSVKRDEAFGQQSAIRIDNDSTRRIDIAIDEVVFSDGSRWENNSSSIEIEPLKLLDNYFSSEYALKGFKNIFGDKARYCPVDKSVIWFCTCGTINSKNENSCHRCRTPKSELLSSLDESALASGYLENTYNDIQREAAAAVTAEDYQRVADRLSELGNYKDSASLQEHYLVQKTEVENRSKYEKAINLAKEDSIPSLSKATEILEEITGWNDSDSQKEIIQDRIGQFKKVKTRKRTVTLITATIIVIVFAGVLLGVFWIMPYQKYLRAKQYLISNNFEDAKKVLVDLGDYKDSPELVTECDYSLALSIMDSDSETAYFLLKGISNYKDVGTQLSMLKPIVFEKGVNLIKSGEYSKAKRLLEDLDYNTSTASSKDAYDLVLFCEDSDAKMLAGEAVDVSALYGFLGISQTWGDLDFLYDRYRFLNDFRKIMEINRWAGILDYSIDTPETGLCHCEYLLSMNDDGTVRMEVNYKTSYAVHSDLNASDYVELFDKAHILYADNRFWAEPVSADPLTLIEYKENITFSNETVTYTNHHNKTIVLEHRLR